MFRNVESHFSLLPNVSIGRSTMDIPWTVKGTGNVGDLIPIDFIECVPGDTHQVRSSKVIRFQTMLSPVMDNLYADFYAFNVPLYTIYDKANEFFGENNSSAWIPQVEHYIPQINLGANGCAKGTVLDYLGIPPGVAAGTVNALPVRAYNLIYNDWFRDENLVNPVNLYTGESTVNYDANDPVKGGKLYKVAKYHDPFTSCLPAPQAGPSVSLSFLGDNINVPVFTSDQTHDNMDYFTNQGVLDGFKPLGLRNAASGQSPSTNTEYMPVTANGPWATYSNSATHLTPINLWAHLDTAPLMTVNQLRQAFQIQKFYENSARSGCGRYVEIIKGHFGVTTPDARLWRPEYLGGNRVPLTVHQVTNNAESANSPLGALGAFCLTADTHFDFTFSSTTHSIIMIVMCIRYDHTYSQGINEYWRRYRKFDFYWPEFSNLGEVGVRNDSVYAQAASITNNGNSDIFGYQEAYWFMRYKPSRTCGEMRPGYNYSLDSWHFADYYSQLPTLSDSWIAETPANVDRTLAVTSSSADQFWFDILFEDRATRPLPVYSIPGLIDHH